MFAHAEIEPADALVIDDSAVRCEWAIEAGARSVHITADASSGLDTALSLHALADRLLAGR